MTLPLSNSDLKTLVLKGGAAVAFFLWAITVTYGYFNLQNQMFELQNTTIRENTKALTEFNLKTK